MLVAIAPALVGYITCNAISSKSRSYCDDNKGIQKLSNNNKQLKDAITEQIGIQLTLLITLLTGQLHQKMLRQCVKMAKNVIRLKK